MSPEQAELSALDIDTRADVYALGVLLYELLTGTTPLDRKRLQAGGLRRRCCGSIREEEPPKPSTRLRVEGVAGQRGGPAADGAGEADEGVRGELDWIVMKCLEKDRTRRYETASGLAATSSGYLDDEPVEACPPSAALPPGEILAAEQGAGGGGRLLLLALVGGIVGHDVGPGAGRECPASGGRAVEEERRPGIARPGGSARSGRRAARSWPRKESELAEANEKRAVAEKQIAEAVRSFLLHDLLRQADAMEQANALRQLGGGFETKENPTVKELLERAAAELTPERIDAKFPGQREVQASILRTVGDAYRGIGDYGKSVEFLTWAYEAFRDSLGPNHDFDARHSKQPGPDVSGRWQVPRGHRVARVSA